MATADERLSYGFSTSFLNANKSIRSLVDKAIDQTWTPQRFLDELRKTSWWKSRSDAQKRYEAMKVENPGEVNRQLSSARTAVWNMATRLGVHLSVSARNNIAMAWVRNGLDEAEVRDMVGKKYKTRFGSTKGGMKRGVIGVAGAARAALDEMGREYGMKISRSSLDTAARLVARGVRDVSDYESHYRDVASRRYKAIANDIREGRTVREIIEPYMATAAQELGIPVSIMDTTNTKWLRPISGDKQFTNDEWVKTIRTDKSYGYDQSMNATRQASILASELMGVMGAK